MENNTDVKNILKSGFEKFSINYDQGKINKLIGYANLVMEFNSHTNITGSKSINNFVQQHIIDCLSAHQFYKDASSVIDVGSGCGLPGIPLSIIYENINFSLCESKKKKCNFLFSAKDKLHLENIAILEKNVYEVKQKFDIITARAFSELKTLIKIYNHLKKNNSKLICYKGKIETIREEINALPKNIDIEIIKLDYKNNEAQRHILIHSS